MADPPMQAARATVGAIGQVRPSGRVQHGRLRDLWERRRCRWWRRSQVLELALDGLVDGQAGRARGDLTARLAAAGGSAVVQLAVQHQVYGLSVRRRQLTSGISGSAVANW